MADFKPPKHLGFNFTPTLHKKAEGPTDPKNNLLPKPFVVLITGAGKGLGYHISLAYARAGASGIIISSRTQTDLDKLKEEIREINPDIKILSRVCDTAIEDDVARLAAETKSMFDGWLDVVVANAGTISKYVSDPDGSNRRLPIGILQDLDFDRVIDINLLGTVRVARHFLPLLISSRQTGEGEPSPQAFIVLTSTAAHIERSFMIPTAYVVSKMATNRIVEHLHNDYAKNGLQAFAVNPGGVMTPMTEKHGGGEGNLWDSLLTDDIGLCGGFLTWLTRTRRDWLSGRYISATWDVDELESKKDEIVREDKLKMRMIV